MRPSGAWRPLAMSCASAGFALPANSASVSLVRLSVVLITAALRAFCPPALHAAACHQARQVSKTGWGGRIRTSEWRDQNPLPYHLATPQHPSFLPSAPMRMGGGRASYAASPTPRVPEKLVERGAVEAPRHEAPPAIGHPPREPLRLSGALEGREDTRAGARQVRGSDAREPLERLGHLG